MDIEIWKDIAGYEGLYRVSSHGNVLSIRKNRLLLPHTHNGGYLYVGLSKSKKSKSFSVHRLVAAAFVEGYEDGLVVNHKDESRNNNHYTNLEWLTIKQNILYGNGRLKHSDACSKPVKGTNIKDGSILYYKSANEASLDGFNKTKIWAICNKWDHSKTDKGYTWERISKEEYKKGIINQEIKETRDLRKKGLQLRYNDLIGKWLGFSYTRYLVIPRSILQSLPVRIQAKFIRAVKEMQDYFECEEIPARGIYKVSLQDGNLFLKDPLRNYEKGRRKITPVELKKINQQYEEANNNDK